MNTTLYRQLARSVARIERDPILDRVKNALHVAGTEAQIASRAGCTEQQAERALRTLRSRRQARKADGVWRPVGAIRRPGVALARKGDTL